MKNESNELILGLASGATYTVTEIFLCRESTLRQAGELRHRANEGLRTPSAGVGFFGSPEWAIGGAIGLGVLQSLASSSAAKSAVSDLQEAARLTAMATQNGAFVALKYIQHIGLPTPSIWRGVVQSQQAGGYEAFVHDGSAFLRVHTIESGTLSIAWDKIETYAPPDEVALPEHAQMGEFGITFNGQQYEYSGYRYDRLADAIRYVQAQRAKA